MLTDPDALLDLLLDLKHDLGKHLSLPITMLPADASDGQLRAALGRALHQTRNCLDGALSARTIWESFCKQAAALPGGPALCETLAPASTRALDWDRRLDDAGLLDRDALQADLRALRDAITQVIAEVDHAP